MDCRVFAWCLLWRIENGSNNSQLCQLWATLLCHRTRRVTKALQVRDGLMRLLLVWKVGSVVTHQFPQVQRWYFSLQVICEKHAQNYMRNGWQVSCNPKAEWNIGEMVPVADWLCLVSVVCRLEKCYAVKFLAIIISLYFCPSLVFCCKVTWKSFPRRYSIRSSSTITT